MLATLAGFLALLLGLSLLLLPLLLTELSRPRDSAWGAVVLLLGLVLVTSAERLTGAPMLAVLCGGLLVGRLGGEVAQGRWRALSDEERQALRSSERWSRSLNQLAVVVASFVQSSLALLAAVSLWLAERRQSRSHGKRWVRSDAPAPSASAGLTEPRDPAQGAASTEPEPTAPHEATAPKEATASQETTDMHRAVAPQAAAAGSEESTLPFSGPPSPANDPESGLSSGTQPESAGERDGAAPIAEPQVAAPEPESPPAGESDSPPGPLDAPPAPDRVDQRAQASDSTSPSPEAWGGVPQDPDRIDPGVRIVSDFDGVDAILAAASEPEGPRSVSSSLPEASDPAPSSQPPPDV